MQKQNKRLNKSMVLDKLVVRLQVFRKTNFKSLKSCIVFIFKKLNKFIITSTTLN